MPGELPESARGDEVFAREPAGLVTGEEDGNGGDVVGFAEAAERGAGDRLPFEIAAHDSGRVRALGLDPAGVDRVDPDLTRAQFPGEHAGDGVDGALGGRVYDRAGRGERADDRADVDHTAACGAEALGRLLGREDQAEDVGVELAVEFGLGDGFERVELVYAGV